MHLRFRSAAIGLVPAAAAMLASSAAMAANCDSLLNKRVTFSGIIDRIAEAEVMVDAIVFKDSKTGCATVLLTPLVDAACRPGRTIRVTAILKKSVNGKTYQMFRDTKAAAGFLTCR